MTPEVFESLVGAPLEEFAFRCHEASLALVKTGALDNYDGLGRRVRSRVARGSCPGVRGQHSWVVIGDPYDPHVPVVDPTLWSYVEDVEGVWTGRADERPHSPFGEGSIFSWGMPQGDGGPEIRLEGISRQAQSFLDLLGPLDEAGWRQLAHAPVGGWPSKEIFAAMYQNPKLAPWIPIDIVGMATDLNPAGLYLRKEE